MPNTQLGDTEKVAYYLTELDADSNPALPSPGDSVSITSSAPGSISVVPDATPAANTVASGFLVGGTTLATGVVITFTVTHADGTTLTTTDTLDLVGGAASSLAVGLGTPVAQ